MPSRQRLMTAHLRQIGPASLARAAETLGSLKPRYEISQGAAQPASRWTVAEFRPREKVLIQGSNTPGSARQRRSRVLGVKADELHLSDAPSSPRGSLHDADPHGRA
jgi:hypothetical protein